MLLTSVHQSPASFAQLTRDEQASTFDAFTKETAVPVTEATGVVLNEVLLKRGEGDRAGAFQRENPDNLGAVALLDLDGFERAACRCSAAVICDQAGMVLGAGVDCKVGFRPTAAND